MVSEAVKNKKTKKKKEDGSWPQTTEKLIHLQLFVHSFICFLIHSFSYSFIHLIILHSIIHCFDFFNSYNFCLNSNNIILIIVSSATFFLSLKNFFFRFSIIYVKTVFWAYRFFIFLVCDATFSTRILNLSKSDDNLVPSVMWHLSNVSVVYATKIWYITANKFFFYLYLLSKKKKRYYTF